MNDELKVDANTIVTRNRVEELVEQALQQGHSTINLSEVQFIGRSVADEFAHHKKASGIQLRGLQDNVDEIINSVDKAQPPTPK